MNKKNESEMIVELLLSRLLRAQVLGHCLDVNEAITRSIDFFHQGLYFFRGHLRAHVCHELLEFWHRNAVIFVTVQVTQLCHHVLWRVLVFQLILHHELQTLIADLPTILRVNLLTHLIKLFRLQVKV